MGKYINFTLIKEKESKKLTEQNTVKAIADLAVSNKQKDLLIQQLSQTVANLNIEIAKLKGGNE